MYGVDLAVHAGRLLRVIGPLYRMVSGKAEGLTLWVVDSIEAWVVGVHVQLLIQTRSVKIVPCNGPSVPISGNRLGFYNPAKDHTRRELFGPFAKGLSLLRAVYSIKADFSAMPSCSTVIVSLSLTPTTADPGRILGQFL
ncbi:hypothetical protein ES703_59074 [subsurface metagenome]